MMLSNNQINILKYLFFNNQINEDDLSNIFDHSFGDYAIQSLLKQSLIIIGSSALYQPKCIYLTENGRAYVEQTLSSEADKRSKKVHEWINTIIAALALIVAVISLATQLWI